MNKGGATVVIIIFIKSFSSTLAHAMTVNLSCVAVDEGEGDKIYPSILKINPNPNTNQTHLDLNLATVDCLERVTRWKKESEKREIGREIIKYSIAR